MTIRYLFLWAIVAFLCYKSAAKRPSPADCEPEACPDPAPVDNCDSKPCPNPDPGKPPPHPKPGPVRPPPQPKPGPVRPPPNPNPGHTPGHYPHYPGYIYPGYYPQYPGPFYPGHYPGHFLFQSYSHYPGQYYHGTYPQLLGIRQTYPPNPAPSYYRPPPGYSQSLYYPGSYSTYLQASLPPSYGYYYDWDGRLDGRLGANGYYYPFRHNYPSLHSCGGPCYNMNYRSKDRTASVLDFRRGRYSVPDFRRSRGSAMYRRFPPRVYPRLGAPFSYGHYGGFMGRPLYGSSPFYGGYAYSYGPGYGAFPGYGAL